MDLKTEQALHRINREFYYRQAASFSRTRSHPWPGWTRVLDLYVSHGPSDPTLHSILDVGCGAGRFARLLPDLGDRPFEYVGFDGSLNLLAQARSALRVSGATRQLILRADLADGPAGIPLARPSQRLGSAYVGHHLIVVFGVLHHIPVFSRRRDLLEDLAARLAPGGLLAATFWQFGDKPRFRRRVIPWEVHNRNAEEPIDPRKLEPGDLLLAWGDREPKAGTWEENLPKRYCHHAGPEEAARLTADLGLETLDVFHADGRSADLNLYIVLQRAS